MTVAALGDIIRPGSGSRGRPEAFHFKERCQLKRKEDVLTTNLRIKELELGVFTPRLQFDEEHIDELAGDIEQN